MDRVLRPDQPAAEETEPAAEKTSAQLEYTDLRACKAEELDSVTIRFVGDSGDGIQLTGNEFSRAIAKAGHDFATHPDYPSEIRAPTGTLFGVSGYQIQFASRQVFTSGDAPDVLVAMNPAALKTNLADVKRGGTLIVNSGAFSDNNLAKAGYESNPLEDGSLGDYRLYRIDISDLTAHALKDSGLSRKETGRCKNYYALGLMLSLYSRPLEKEEEDIRSKFAGKPEIAEANVLALRAGYAYADATEMFVTSYRVRSADIRPGTYRSLTGNHAAALGMTTTSGPGMALKTEALGLAVMLELPLVIVNVQRGGPSTGLPTKIEQSDLLQAVYGRNGECPIPVIDAHSPAEAAEHGGLAFFLSQFGAPKFPVPLGVFRAVHAPTYEELSTDLAGQARRAKGPSDLATLLAGGETWTID